MSNHRINRQLHLLSPKGKQIDIELFAGAGGMTLGLAAAGLPPDHLFEMNAYCCATLERNSRGSARHITGSVHREDVGQVDWSQFKRPVRLLSGGPPCQPFSLAGKHLAERDGRNQFPTTLRAVRALRPAAVLLENVPGLLRASFRPYLDYVARQLEFPSLAPKPGESWDEHDARLRRHQSSAAYRPEYHVRRWALNAADFGVAQCRVRVVLVATRIEFDAVAAPVQTHGRDALVEAQSTGLYWRKRRLTPKPRDEWPNRLNGTAAKLDDLRCTNASVRPWSTVRDALAGLSAPSLLSDVDDGHWLIPGARLYTRHSGSELDWPAKTIKAGVHGVAGGENVLVLDDGSHRYFTLREMARLQCFPNDYFFEGPRSRVIGQIGNAVPCDLAELLGRAILRALGQEEPASSATVRQSRRRRAAEVSA